MLTVAFVILAYLLGAIPFGLIIVRQVKGIDLRKVGSGNIGTANSIRAVGAKWGIFVFLMDVVKGYFPVFAYLYTIQNYPGLGQYTLTPYTAVFTSFAAIIGHNYPVYLKFKGGKGIATSFGVFLALSWQYALGGLAVWNLVVDASKISSLGYLAGAISIPIFMLSFSPRPPVEYIIFGFIAATLAFYRHKENIGRLIRGEERKISDKAQKKEEEKPEKKINSENILSENTSTATAEKN